MKGYSLLYAVLICLLGICLVAEPVSASDPGDTPIAVLGTLGGDSSVAYDINDLGQVVGRADTAEGKRHAFLWSSSTGMTDLGTLGGTNSRAEGINELGQVVGCSDITGGFQRAFLWTTATGMTDLGTLGGNSSCAYDINDLGEVVGSADTTEGEQHAFLWTAATGMLDLGTLGGTESHALGLNNFSQVVGWSDTTDGFDRAFIWSTATGMLELGTLGGDASYARDINDLAQVVGTSENDDTYPNAFLWTATDGMIGLDDPTAWSWADAINNRGQVVGATEIVVGEYPNYVAVEYGFVWSSEDGISVLTSFPYAVYMNDINNINNVDQIVGSKYMYDHDFLEEGPFAVVAHLYPPGTSHSRIAFSSDRDGGLDLFTMDANGTGQTSVAHLPADDRHPAWSSDRSKLAFFSTSSGNQEIYVVNTDGSGLQNVTNHPGDDAQPAWSPDDTKIAFASSRDGNWEIYAMNADGSGQVNLTGNAERDADPVWSPDGTKLAFSGDRNGNRDIYVMNADGTGQTRLTDHAANDEDPSWSPDGSRISFQSDRDGNPEIYVMQADGTGQTNLTNDPSWDWESTWSPDSEHIAFSTYRLGNWEIFVMNADGSGQTNLTNHPADEYYPAWSSLYPPSTSLLANHDFEYGTSEWRFYTNGQGNFTTVPDAYAGSWSAQVSLTSPGTNVQLYQPGISLKPDTTYRLGFAAFSNHESRMSVFLHKHDAPYTQYGLTDYEVYVGTRWNWYEIEFTTTGFSDPVDDARLRFWFAPYDSEDTIYHIDHVMLYEASGYLEPLPAPEPPPAPPEGHCTAEPGNVVLNPGFETGTSSWSFYTDGRGSLLTATPGYECTYTGRVKIVEQGSNVQLYQKGITLEPHTAYRLRVAAKSTTGRDVSLFLHKHTSPYTSYGLNGVVLDLSDSWQVFQVQFTTVNFDDPVSDARLRFYLGATDKAGEDFYIDDVVLAKLDDLEVGAAATAVVVDGGPMMLLESGYFIDADDEGWTTGQVVPECTDIQVRPEILWPANNKMMDIAFTEVTGMPTSVSIDSITQDELVGDDPDAILAEDSLKLRAERDGNGDGRVYTVNLTSYDGLCSSSVRISVPHDQAQGAVDSGGAYDSMTPSAHVHGSAIDADKHRALLPYVVSE